MDDGFTEHSGCPVIEGEKWITTFWMRKGVTAEENWQLYDPMGVRILESS
jgi:prolyl 4-hydroxylase